MYSGEKDFHYNVKGSFTMRKLVSLGLFALSLSFLANPVFAGNEALCESLKDNQIKALYGLCIAWHNAGNDVARESVYKNFKKKAGVGGPILPGGPDDLPPPSQSDAEPCPCWSESHLAEASVNGVPADCSFNGGDIGISFAVYDDELGNDNYYQFYMTDSFCFRVDPNSDGAIGPIGSESAEATCRAGIEVLVNDDFGGACP
jgi:hypothetical protein